MSAAPPDAWDLLVRLFQAVGAASIVLAVGAIFRGFRTGRKDLVAACSSIGLCSRSWRLQRGGSYSDFSRVTSPAERLLLVGTGAAAIDLARELFDLRQAWASKSWGSSIPTQRKWATGHQSRRDRHARGHPRADRRGDGSIGSS